MAESSLILNPRLTGRNTFISEYDLYKRDSQHKMVEDSVYARVAHRLIKRSEAVPVNNLTVYDYQKRLFNSLLKAEKENQVKYPLSPEALNYAALELRVLSNIIECPLLSYPGTTTGRSKV